MLLIKAPASSANMGPGFDCLGLAVNIYNSFEVELSDHTCLEGVEERFNNENNLFLQAYRKGCEAIGVSDHIHAVFHCDIPVSRGLGSSASMICAGLTAASALHNDALSEGSIFQLASEMEGHPDNAAPCLFGGMMASLKTENNAFISHPMELHEDWLYTVLIPDFEVSTEEARGILPSDYPRADAAANTAHAIIMTEALRTGSSGLLKLGANDLIHEPYRSTLIDGYETVKNITEKDTDGKMLISGSGSTCILISKRPLSSYALAEIKAIPGHSWQVREVSPAFAGTEITEASYEL